MLAHNCFQSLDPDLVLQRNGKPVKGPHNPARNLQLFIKPGCTCQCLIDEYLSKAVSLQETMKRSVDEGKDKNMAADQLMCNNGPLGKCRGNFHG